jgi:hypothetical protein
MELLAFQEELRSKELVISTIYWFGISVLPIRMEELENYFRHEIGKI